MAQILVLPFITFTAAAGATGFAATAFGAFLTSSVLGQFLVSTVLGAALRALSPKPSVGGSRGYQTNQIGPAQDHSVIYGEVKVGGAIIYDEATGTNNKFLHRVIAVAGHEIDSFVNFYINDELATVDGSGNVTSPTQYNGKIRINTHTGSPSQVADADLVAESASGGWDAQCTLSGIAYIYVRLKFNADAFPNGIPTFTTTVRGKKVYDPRTSAVAFSSNPALCMRDYLTSGKGSDNTTSYSYGLGEDVVNVDDAMVITSANVCDQTNTNAGTTRYTTNGSFTTASTPYDTLTAMLTAMGGSMWYAQGKWRMKSAYYTTPVMDLNEDDLRSGISVGTRHSRRDNFNTIKGTFRGLESDWQVTDYPEVTNAAFVTADGGQVSVADVDLPFTDTSVTARRLGLISLERNRQQLTVNASYGLRTLGLQVGDNVRITNSRFGWTNKEFEVIQWSFGLVDGLDLQVDMSLRETAESVFDEVSDGIVYERDNTQLLSPFDVPSVGLSAVARTQIIREKLTNVITLSVTSGAPERIDYVEAEYKLSSSSVYISLGTGQLGDFEAIDLVDGDYDFRARAVNTFGIKGLFELLDGVNAAGLLEPPSDVVNFTAEVNGSVITFDWDAVPDLDLSFYRIRFTPDLTGATWANSTTYVNKVPRPASVVSAPAKSGSYTIRAYDKSGIASINYTTTIVLPADIEPFANSLTLTDSTGFTGTKVDVEVVGTNLRITDFSSAPSEGEYFFSNYIETSTNTVKRSRVYVSATTVRHDSSAGLFDDQSGFFDDGAGLFDDLGGSSQFADTDIVAFVSTTQDDPSGSPVWSAYSRINVADISARAYRFKIKLLSTASNITPSVTELTAYVEYN